MVNEESQIDGISTVARQYYDNGLFLRGMIQVMLSDGIAHEPQKELIFTYGRKMGYERDFLETAIDSALANKHLSREHPKFFSRANARRFLKAAVSIARANLAVHPYELLWLRQAAQANSIPERFVTLLVHR